MMAFIFSKFFNDWITLIQSFWFAFEILLNFPNQNIGLSNICFDDWLISRQISASSSVKLPKTFSARCANPGLFKIFSRGLTIVLDWIWAANFFFSSIKFCIWSHNSSKFHFSPGIFNKSINLVTWYSGNAILSKNMKDVCTWMSFGWMKLVPVTQAFKW